MLRLVVLLLLSLCCLGNETYYANPSVKKASSNGTKAKPWGSLEEAISKGYFKKVKPGDTVLLLSGFHGNVKIAGANKDFITLAGAPGHVPKLSRFEITQGSKWKVKGIVVSPSFTEKPYKNYMVSLGERGPSNNLILEDCFVYTALETKDWTVDQWKRANSGILLGRHGKNLVVRNTYVLNTRHGVSLCSPLSLCEGNVVSDFSGDGIRATRDDQVLQYNVIKNAYCSGKDGDSNHDDAIQCFLFNKGTGLVRNVTVRGNLILDNEDKHQKYKSFMQAIGFFDGPLINFLVEDNVVRTRHWQGVCLCDAQSCKILNNVVFNKEKKDKMMPWVKLIQKKNLAKDNVVKNNLAHSFSFRADKTVTADNNKRVSEKMYNKRFKALLKVINKKFGAKHVLADRGRIKEK